MTNQQHPITPPPEVEQRLVNGPGTWREKIVNAYRAGADAELDAIFKMVGQEDLPEEDRYFDGLFDGLTVAAIRAIRRPKPPSLAEQALDTLRSMRIEPVFLNGINVNKHVMDQYSIIERALERLQQLEQENHD